MWCMAKGTVFGSRRMLPNIGPAFLGVTLKTRIVDRLTDQLSIGGSSMRAVTAAAIHLSFEERMRKCFQCFAALQLMAIEADVRLCRGMHHGISRRMADMTVGTGDLIIIVGSAVPAEADVRIVAIEAVVVLYADLGFPVRTEFDDRRAFLATPDPGRVCSTRSVTGLALQLAATKRATRVRGHCMPGTKYSQRQLIIVAGQAGIGAFPAVRNFRVRCILCLCS